MRPLGCEVRTVAEGVYGSLSAGVFYLFRRTVFGHHFIRANIGGLVVVRRLAVVR